MSPENPSGAEAANYDGLDLSDLPFDIERHREGIRAFAKLNLDPQSVKPALRARDLVSIRVSSGMFRIGAAGGDTAAQEAAEKARGGTDFEIIHQCTGPEEAATIRSEVERYFLRHFPGRTLQGTPNAASSPPYFVYVARYAPVD